MSGEVRALSGASVPCLLAVGLLCLATAACSGSDSKGAQEQTQGPTGGSPGVCDPSVMECGDSSAPASRDAGSAPVTFPAEALSTFTSDGKDLTIELRTAPEQPVHVGPDGEAQLHITDASTGAAVDGLEIAVTTLMPVMRHPCSPVVAKVEAQGQGVYLLTPFLASMKGACEIKLAISGSRSEHAVSPTFDVTE